MTTLTLAARLRTFFTAERARQMLAGRREASNKAENEMRESARDKHGMASP